MANLLAPFGFSQIGVLDGSPPNFGNSIRLISKTNATPIYRGDPVTTLNTGYIAQSTAGTTQIHGIFAGCKRISISTGMATWSKNWVGSDALTDVEAYVIAPANATFVVQANGQLLSSHVGMNANFALGTGNTYNGISGATLDVSTIAATSTLPFRIVGVESGASGQLPSYPPGWNGSDLTTPYSLAIVTFNNQDFKSLTGI